MGGLCISREVKIQSLLNQLEEFNQSNANSVSSRALQQLEDMDREIRTNPQKNSIFETQHALLEARQNHDIEFMLKHIENSQIPCSKIKMGHPWAQNPETLGSIATMYLSILFMQEHDDEEQLESGQHFFQKHIQMMNSQIIFQKFAKNLSHQDIDRRQITLLVLVFLVEFEELRPQFLQNDIFEKVMSLLQLKRENVLGQRIACGFILRELYKNNPKYVQKVLKDSLVLDSFTDFLKSDNQQHIIEGLNCLDDLCYDENYKSDVSVVVCRFLYERKVMVDLEEVRERLQEEIDLYPGHPSQEIKSLTIDLINCLITKFLQFKDKK